MKIILKKCALFTVSFIIAYLFLGFLTWLYFYMQLENMMIHDPLDTLPLAIDVSDERIKDVIEVNFYISLVVALIYVVFKSRKRKK